jgi:diguanylate cyclase (GGDEF)-like protein/putative nucleotidyltransferase with HDIG domain
MVVYAVLYATTEDETLRANATTALTALAALSALAGSLWALTRTESGNRRVWITMVISTVAFSTGWLYRLVFVVDNGTYPSAGTIEDVAFTVGFLALVPTVMFMSQPRKGIRLTHARQALDLAIVALAVLAGLALLLLVPLRIVGAEMGLAASAAFGIYAALSAALVVYLLAFKHTRWTTSEALILAGLASGALAVLGIVSALELYQPTTMWSAVPNSLMTAGFLFFALAGVHAATRVSVSGGPGRTVLMPAWTEHASTAIALVGVPWLIIAASQAEERFARTLLTGVAVMLVVAVAVRNILMTAENTQLTRQATHDPLTGLYNERYLHERVAEELDRSQSEGTDTCVCVLIIDGQDERSQREGFSATDALVQKIARMIETTAGLNTAYRTDSDRFALLLPATNAVEAYETCASAARTAGPKGKLGPVTFSIGIASARLTSWDPEALISNARGAAYWAASSGGDRIVLFDPEVVKATDSRTHIENLEEQSHIRLLEALAAAVDARDPYTRYHSANVSRLVRGLAEHLGMPADRVDLLTNAALMHDLGKIGIADSILLKPGELSADEYAVIRTHSELGARILRSGSKSEIITWVRSHHERWDGQGYPDGLSAESIPYEARMLTLCDAYDAMTSDRPYRAGLSVTEAVEELRRCSGTQFDPGLVEPFLESLIALWPETGGQVFRPSDGEGSGRSTIRGDQPSL